MINREAWALITFRIHPFVVTFAGRIASREVAPPPPPKDGTEKTEGNLELRVVTQLFVIFFLLHFFLGQLIGHINVFEKLFKGKLLLEFEIKALLRVYLHAPSVFIIIYVK